MPDHLAGLNPISKIVLFVMYKIIMKALIYPIFRMTDLLTLAIVAS